jgi:hypothetical protein
MKTGIAILVAAGFVSAANAGVIINQLPTDKLNGLVSQETAGFEARSADDFALPTGNGGMWDITRLKGVLFTNEKITPGSGKFEIYADGGGTPTGSPLYTFNADAANLVGNNYGLNLVEFAVGDGVNTLFNANAGDTLWISTVGTSTQSFQYFATFNFGGPVNGYDGHWKGAAFGYPNWDTVDSQFGGPSDFAFAVEGDQRVPAPAAAAVLGLGGLMAGRRRRA